jgi:beta-phosphoglucomutase-like phosphatase (HAD superfamily)
MDGTIIDSMKLWRGIEYQYLDSIGVKYDDNVIEATKHMSPRDWYEWISENVFKGTRTASDINAAVIDIVANKYETVEMYDGVLKYLKKLKSDGCKIAIASANFNRLVSTVMRIHNLSDIVDITFTQDDVENKVGYNKNLLFEKCVKHFNCKPSDCVIYEDSIHALNYANEIGFTDLVLHNSNNFNIGTLKCDARVIVNWTNIK